jgi:hypothetical protein
LEVEEWKKVERWERARMEGLNRQTWRVENNTNKGLGLDVEAVGMEDHREGKQEGRRIEALKLQPEDWNWRNRVEEQVVGRWNRPVTARAGQQRVERMEEL